MLLAWAKAVAAKAAVAAAAGRGSGGQWKEGSSCGAAEAGWNFTNLTVGSGGDEAEDGPVAGGEAGAGPGAGAPQKYASAGGVGGSADGSAGWLAAGWGKELSGKSSAPRAQTTPSLGSNVDGTAAGSFAQGPGETSSGHAKM